MSKFQNANEVAAAGFFVSRSDPCGRAESSELPANHDTFAGEVASGLVRIAHVTDHYSKEAGGITAAIDQLSRRLSADHASEIICVRGNPMPAAPGVQVFDIPPSWIGRPWGWSPQLARKLSDLLYDPLVTTIHVHGVWMAPQYLAAKLANRRGRPFVVSTHGMLEPALWQTRGAAQRLKKSLYWSLIGSSWLQRTALVHAITPRECDNLRPLFPKSRIEVIPHAIDVRTIDGEAGPFAAEPEHLFVFLGRIHPHKGIELLLDGFAAARLPTRWRLVVAGPEWSGAYTRSLRNRVVQLGLSARVEFIGPVFGQQKWSLLKRAWVVAVPSRSEVMGMVNLEAAACGTPTITTAETGLENWEEAGGVLISCHADQMAKALKQASAWSSAERLSRGNASRQMVQKKYRWEVVLPLWRACYESLL